jgi:hypothetical protein
MKLLVEAPLNTLSFGNVAYNILRELSKRPDIEVGVFPVGNIDLSSFSVKPSMQKWLQDSISKRWLFLSEKTQVLKLWHLNGGENRKSSRQNLLTFYECSKPTATELAICKSQDKTLFSSTYSKDIFEANGCSNCEYIPMGFDEDITVTGKKYLDGVIHFGLMGKFEKRKHTASIVKAWLKKFGNDNRYQLSCCITNPFLKQEDMQAILVNLLEGKRYTNINFLPYLRLNNEVNEFMNSIDIDLTGLSGGEGWNLPSFNATCLGKWSIVLDATSHQDWATADNSILIQPNGTMTVSDGMFFGEGQRAFSRDEVGMPPLRTALASVGRKAVDQHSHRRTGTAAVTVRAVGEQAAAAKPRTH